MKYELLKKSAKNKTEAVTKACFNVSKANLRFSSNWNLTFILSNSGTVRPFSQNISRKFDSS